MPENKYPRGSEWKRWDLHIHTPFSYLANEFGDPAQEDTWDNYVKNLFQKALDILAARSYFDERRAMVQSYADYLDELRSQQTA